MKKYDTKIISQEVKGFGKMIWNAVYNIETGEVIATSNNIREALNVCRFWNEKK
jgi:hypothetical protein